DGGPTAAASSVLDLTTQFWTTAGSRCSTSTTAAALALAAPFVIACTSTGASSTSMTVLMAPNSSLQKDWSMANGWSSGAVVLAATPRWRRWCFGISFTAERATTG